MIKKFFKGEVKALDLLIPVMMIGTTVLMGIALFFAYLRFFDISL